MKRPKITRCLWLYLSLSLLALSACDDGSSADPTPEYTDGGVLIVQPSTLELSFVAGTDVGAETPLPYPIAPLTLTVQARALDADGAPVPTFTGVVQLSSSAGALTGATSIQLVEGVGTTDVLLRFAQGEVPIRGLLDALEPGATAPLHISAPTISDVQRPLSCDTRGPVTSWPVVLEGGPEGPVLVVTSVGPESFTVADLAAGGGSYSTLLVTRSSGAVNIEPGHRLCELAGTMREVDGTTRLDATRVVAAAHDATGQVLMAETPCALTDPEVSGPSALPAAHALVTLSDRDAPDGFYLPCGPDGAALDDAPDCATALAGAPEGHLLDCELDHHGLEPLEASIVELGDVRDCDLDHSGAYNNRTETRCRDNCLAIPGCTLREPGPDPAAFTFPVLCAEGECAGEVAVTNRAVGGLPLWDPELHGPCVAMKGVLLHDRADGEPSRWVVEQVTVTGQGCDGTEGPAPEALALNSIIPNRGVTAGGTELRIVGWGFTEDTGFELADQPCADVRIESANHARCITPPGPLGPVDLRAIRAPEGGNRVTATLDEAFTYFEPVLLTAITPVGSPTRGGISVLLEGTGLIEGTLINIGGRRALGVQAQPNGTLLAQVPAHEVGAVDVTASNFNGASTLVEALYYYEEIRLVSVTPPIGSTAGGELVTLYGEGLTAQSRVFFGDRLAEVEGARQDHSALTVIAPAGRAGPVDVLVENQNGESRLSDGYLYFDPDAEGFQVTGVAPIAGPVEGGGALHIAGAGFTVATTARFGPRPLNCEHVDAHRLVCDIPPGDVGPVDVVVEEAGQEVTLPGAYTYFQGLELLAIIPDRGAIAGGTQVTLVGTGFPVDLNVALGGQDLVDLQVIDETTAVGFTPSNTPGPVDVRISTDHAEASIIAGFNYFDPTSRFGGVWGEPLDGAINITVLHSANSQPLDEAAVVLVFEDEGAEIILDGVTNGEGQLTLSHPALTTAATITAAKEEFEATTIEDVEVENITVYLVPNTGEGAPPPGIAAAILAGDVSGLDLLPKPSNERYVNVIFIDTTHSSPYNRPQLPPPGPGGLLLEDGPFEIIAMPGEMAIVATAAELDLGTKAQYEAGEIGYWDMRRSVRPLSMGLRRFISASPGQRIEGLNVVLDHPLDLTVPMDLDNPPAGGDIGPQLYAVLPRLNLGAEGYWELDAQAVSMEPSLSVNRLPRLEGWADDLSYYLIGLAVSSTVDNTPMSVTIEDTRDVAAGVLITPFVGAPRVITPLTGAALGPDRRVEWDVFDGYSGPITPPHGNLVAISEPSMGPPTPLWRYITPGLVTEFVVPDLPMAAGSAGLGAGAMFLDIMPFYVDGPFNFDEFTYSELNQYRWKAWGVSSTSFTQ